MQKVALPSGDPSGHPSGFKKILFDEAHDLDSEKSKKMADITSIKITNIARPFITYHPVALNLSYYPCELSLYSQAYQDTSTNYQRDTVYQAVQEDQTTTPFNSVPNTHSCSSGELTSTDPLCSAASASLQGNTKLTRFIEAELLPVGETLGNENPKIIQPFSAIQTKSDVFTPHSWDEEIQQYSSDLASLNEFIQSLPFVALTKRDAQNRTICHALCSLSHCLSFAEVEYLPELLSRVCLPQCMVCRDSSGNTPLHCAIETQNASADIVKSILGFVPPECLAVRNADNCTPLDLAFEKNFWVPARALAEHQLITGAANSPEFLQGYFFKAMREQGGVDFLPYLLDLRGCYCPEFDLNFGIDTTGHTPWWYLVNSNDVSVMCRTLQALKNHSVDLTRLLTHIGTGAMLVEEAIDKNKGLFTMIRKVTGWHHSEDEADQDTYTEDQDIISTLSSTSTLSRSSSCSSLSSFDQSESHDLQLELEGSLNVIEGQSLHMSSTSSSDDQFSSKPRKVSPRTKFPCRIKNKGTTSSTTLQNTKAH